jgi:hypothetical protein
MTLGPPPKFYGEWDIPDHTLVPPFNKCGNLTRRCSHHARLPA